MRPRASRQARHTWALGAASPRASRHLPRPHPPRAAPTASRPGDKVAAPTPHPVAPEQRHPLADPGPRRTRTRSARERDGGARAPVTASRSPPRPAGAVTGVGNGVGVAGPLGVGSRTLLCARVCAPPCARVSVCAGARPPRALHQPRTNLSAATPSSRRRGPSGQVFPRSLP